METVRWRLRNIPDYQSAPYDRKKDSYMILVDGDFVDIPKESFEKLFEQVDEKDHIAEQMFQDAYERQAFGDLPEDVKKMYKYYIKKNIQDDGSFDMDSFYSDVIGESLKNLGQKFIDENILNKTEKEFIDFVLSRIKENYPNDYEELIDKMSMSEIRGTLADVYQAYLRNIPNETNE